MLSIPLLFVPTHSYFPTATSFANSQFPLLLLIPFPHSHYFPFLTSPTIPPHISSISLLSHTNPPLLVSLLPPRPTSQTYTSPFLTFTTFLLLTLTSLLLLPSLSSHHFPLTRILLHSLSPYFPPSSHSHQTLPTTPPFTFPFCPPGKNYDGRMHTLPKL